MSGSGSKTLLRSAPELVPLFPSKRISLARVTKALRLRWHHSVGTWEAEDVHVGSRKG